MLSRGSEWLRWEPHIHAPGTIKNDGFKGTDVWNAYLTSIEQASPTRQAALMKSPFARRSAISSKAARWLSANALVGYVSTWIGKRHHAPNADKVRCVGM